MHEKIILFASPVFFLLIIIELIAAKRRQRYIYRFNDAINSISLGIMSQITAVFHNAYIIGIYAWVAHYFSFFQLPADAIWVWVSGLFLYDFLYYWLHRFGHETNILWAAHVVHHQSEEYNLSTALRQPSLGALIARLFYLPMAILGFPVQMVIVIGLIDLIYQFWVHTQHIDKLGWFDRIFVSPSNHRVHHAVNDLYLDKNYGGILIIWDRIFGTFIEEQAAHPVVFGTRKSLRSWNPLWANLEVYQALAVDAWRTKRWRDKLKIWFMPPGWQPADLVNVNQSAPFNLQHPLFNPSTKPGMLWYCLAQFALTIFVGTHFLHAAPKASVITSGLYGIWLIAGLWINGGLLEQKAHFILLETARLILTAAMLLNSPMWFGLVRLEQWLQLSIIAACLASLMMLLIINKSAVFNKAGNVDDIDIAKY